MTLNFDPAELHKIIKKIEEETSFSGVSDHTAIAFPPKDGTFRARFILDPRGQRVREMRYYHFGRAKSLVPPDGVPNAIAEKYAATDDWHLKPRLGYLMYACVYEASPSTQYFEGHHSGKPYAIVGSSRMKKALIGALSAMAKDAPDFAIAAVNPQLPGGYILVTSTAGPQGNCVFTPIPGALKPAIITSENQTW